MKRKHANDDDRIKELMGKLVEYQTAELPDEELLQECYRLSDLFHQRIAHLIRAQTEKAKRREWRRGIGAAAAVLLLLFWLGNPGLVAEAANRVFEWLSDHVSFQFKEDTDINWIPRYRIGYVPEGYELVEDVYFEDGALGGIRYYKARGNKYIDLSYLVIDGGLAVDNNKKELIYLKGKNNQKIYYLKGENNDSSFTWCSEDGTTKFNLSGFLTEEELMKIYESITIVEK